MGLPSKKQLHKHKRGTRKALDTLDAMEKSDDKIIDDVSVEKLVKTKKSKKSTKKSKKKKSVNKQEKSVEPPVLENTANIKLNEDSKDEQISQSPANDVKNSGNLPESQEKPVEDAEPEKKGINLDGLEEESFIEETDETEPAPENEKEITTDPQEDSDESKKSKVTISDEYDETFEDTQKDKYLTFRIGDESFGFAIKFITEIIVMHKITEVPDTPTFVQGVINLRGKVIPVIDVRQRFNMELRDYDERTCIIVVEYIDTAVGLIVDTVNEVADIPEDQIDPPPRTHSGIGSSYILGMGKVGKEVNILLNLEKVLFVDEILAKRRILEEK